MICSVNGKVNVSFHVNFIRSLNVIRKRAKFYTNRKKMTNCNKLNLIQKDMMADFMQLHPNLAKNLIPGCAQGKATSNRLWEELARKLNAVGPPTKDARMWKKVFADQKYQAKKKLSFNKASKRKTGGGPYEEKLITFAEERLIEAAGLEASVEGNTMVPSFGINRRASTPSVSEIIDVFIDEGNSNNESTETPSKSNLDQSNANISVQEHSMLTQRPKPKKSSAVDPKLQLLEQNLSLATDFQKKLDAKLDRLLEIQERLLVIKEEKHKVFLEQNVI